RRPIGFFDRHPSESWDPVTSNHPRSRHWIPAFAGMTSLKRTEDDARVVVEADLAALLATLEQFAQLGEHRFVLRMAFLRRVGRRHQPAAQAVEVQQLLVLEARRAAPAGAEPAAHAVVVGVAL